MADDPTPPGTNGGAKPGEDGADQSDDGAEGSGETTDGALEGETEDDEANAPERGEDETTEDAADGDGPAGDRTVGDERDEADDEPGASGQSEAEQGVPGAGRQDGSVGTNTRGNAHTDDHGGTSGDGTRGTLDDGSRGTFDEGPRDTPAGGPPDTSGDIPGDVPTDVQKYQRFKKVDGAQYDRVNEFLRDRSYITAREWAMARLCADFRTETGVEMTKIGENLPELVPFMEDTYSPQAVNQARSSFEEKVTKAGATFLYGAMCDFFTAEELDELMYEVTEVAKFLLEVEAIDLTVEEELDAEDRISGVMREVREASEALRYEECPHCGEQLQE